MKLTKALALSAIASGLVLTSCKKDEDENNGGTTGPCDMKITNADGPQVGDSYIAVDADFDETTVTAQIAISGSDKTWDFSSLTQFGNGEDNDTLGFLDASNAPAGVNANLSLQGEGDIYLNSSSTGLDIVSLDFDAEEDVEFEITNPLSFIPYSLKMNTNVTDEFVIEGSGTETLDTLDLGFQVLYDVPLEIDMTQSNSNEFTVDGCGTITTPKGEFDCLRYIVEPGEAEFDVTISANIGGVSNNIPVTQDDIDEYTEGQDFNMFEGTTYVWISKDHGYPLVQVTLDENGDIDYVQYLK